MIKHFLNSHGSSAKAGRLRPAILALVVVSVLSAVPASAAFAAGDANMTECPAATEESPGFRTYLPDCMAYEMVSPDYMQGFPPVGGIGGSGHWAFNVGSSGDRVAGLSVGSFAEPAASWEGSAAELGLPYLFTREQAGWGPHALMPSISELPSPEVLDFSTDLESSLWITGNQESFGETTAPVQVYRREPTGAFSPVGPFSEQIPEGGAKSAAKAGYLGAAADLSRFVFAISRNKGELSPNPFWPGDPTLRSNEEAGGRNSLYEYEIPGNAEPSLVGVTNDTSLRAAAEAKGMHRINEAAEAISQCGTELGSSTAGGHEGDKFNAVSTNGFGIFFTAAAGGCQVTETPVGGSHEVVVEEGLGPSVNELYVRIRGMRTLALSEPPLSVPGRRCTGVCAEYQNEEGGHERSEGYFFGASEAGDRVYFSTAQPLVDEDTDATEDLYMEELDESEVTRIVDVSAGGEGDPTPGSGANLQGVVRVAADGSRVYFVARGVLTTNPNGNGESAEDGADNLYLYNAPSGSTQFVARLAEKDGADELWSRVDRRLAQASRPSGRYLVFASRSHLQGTADSSGDGTSVRQLFRYDAEDGALVRVSIGQKGEYLCKTTGLIEAGYNCNGNVQSNSVAPTLKVKEYQEKDHAGLAFSLTNVTPDGTVFFESKAALTPQAANGFPNSEPGFNNIYEYKEGNVYLISDGVEAASFETATRVPETRTRLVGATEQGGLLFVAADSLVPQDTNGQISLYEARPDGGFPAEDSGSQCLGEGCRGPGTAPSSVTAAGTESFTGPGNHRPAKKGKRKKQKHCAARASKAQKAKNKKPKGPACKKHKPNAKRKGGK